jgi:hypothetical protein
MKSSSPNGLSVRSCHRSASDSVSEHSVEGKICCRRFPRCVTWCGTPIATSRANLAMSGECRDFSSKSLCMVSSKIRRNSAVTVLRSQNERPAPMLWLRALSQADSGGQNLGFESRVFEISDDGSAKEIFRIIPPSMSSLTVQSESVAQLLSFINETLAK